MKLKMESLTTEGNLDQYKALLAESKALLEKSRALVKVAFLEGAKALFAAHPDLKRFGWEQYTPHFCDGDPCHFGIRSDMHINGYDEREDEGGDWSFQQTGLTDERKSELERTVWNLVREFDYDDLEAVFGDGVSVHITPEGITTEGYDHY